MGIDGVTDVVEFDETEGHFGLGDDGEGVEGSEGGEKFVKLGFGGGAMKIGDVEDIIVVFGGVGHRSFALFYEYKY